ncbi:MAG: insulinase family protein [Pyrinomonadaceae bacterium]|nr:insulinase family protein [Pyrinomonadaceae bacterium]
MKFLTICLLFLAFVLPVSAQNVTAASAVTEFDVNGLKVIFKRRTSSPTVSAGLFIRGGVRNQTAANAGIESLTLTAAVEASKNYPRTILRKEMSRMGSVISAGASYDFGVLALTSTSQHFPRSWEIFTDTVLNPTFLAEDVDRVKALTLAGLRNESASPDSALDSLEQKVVYAGHPYANPPLGTIESVTKLTPADLKAYHQKLLQTSRLLLVIVGDADLVEIKRLVTASFAGLPKGTYSDNTIPAINFPKPSVDVSQRTINTNYVKGVFAAPSIGDPDYYAMRVAIALLQSRVYQEVRVKRNLSYAPNAEMGNLAANTGEIYVTSVDPNQSVRIMLGEIEGLKSRQLDPEDVAGVPGFFLTTYYIDQETNSSQAAELARYELVGGGWRNSIKFLDGIRGVKAADVQAAANKYMKNVRFVVVGDAASIDRGVFVGQ